MNKKRKFLVLLAVLLFSLIPVSVATVKEAAAATSTRAVKKSGLVREGKRYYYYKKGKRIKSKWMTVGKYRYYFGEKGYAVTPCVKLKGKAYAFDSRGRLLRQKKKRIVKSGKYYFYVDKNGVAATGWFMVGSKLYRADSKGRIYTNRTYQGVSFGSKGAAKNNTASRLKIKAKQVVNSITTSKMSKARKLQACWNYLANSGKFRYLSMSPNLARKGWQKEFALSMLETRRGSCSSFACAFAALASEIGYNPYIIYGRVPGSRDGAADGMTRHCWVKINGLHYDPEAQFAGWARGIYGLSSFPFDYTLTTYFNFEKG